MKVKSTLFIIRSGEEIEVDISGDYYPGHGGNLSRNPDLYDPETLDEVEDICAWNAQESFELSIKEEDDAFLELLNVGKLMYENCIGDLV